MRLNIINIMYTPPSPSLPCRTERVQHRGWPNSQAGHGTPSMRGGTPWVRDPLVC